MVLGLGDGVGVNFAFTIQIVFGSYLSNKPQSKPQKLFKPLTILPTTMKNLIFFLFLLPSFAFANNAQGNPSLEAISAALGNGDVTALSKYLADNVEISIQGKEQVYTKAKASEVLKSFFETNKPKSFAQVHKGQSRENSDQYCIGNLSATAGSYRVYLYLKVVGSSISIQEMRFDKE